MTDHDDVRRLARPLVAPADLDPLLDRIGDARLVLLGEASHGTHEYYAWRAELTGRLVREHGFSFVAVEGDWPDCAAVDRSVRLDPDAPDDPRQVLDAFDRWPTWMWANEDVVAFTRDLRALNAERPPERRVGFHGLDVYSLGASLRAVVDYVREHEPDHLPAALAACRCFEPYRERPEDYAWATMGVVPTSCEDEVVRLLGELRRAVAAERRHGDADAFEARQNAEVIAGAERYYRAMLGGNASSWNVRDTHMADTLDRLLERYGPESRGVVWEHNTHVGDARHTDMRRAGMVNVGQLARERHGADRVVLVGFGGHRGTVVAAGAWGAASRVLRVPPARPGSVEALLHEADVGPSLFVFDAPDEQPSWLRRPRDHRAIGVVYDPELERYGNYVPTVLGSRYDAFAWFEETRALRPLHGEPAFEPEPATFPSGA